MMTSRVLLLAGFAMSACTHSSTTHVPVSSPAQGPPVALVRPVVDRYFGQEIVDPYRWMEKTDSPEFVEWMRGQNTFTRATLARIRGRATMLEKLRAYTQGGPAVGNVFIVGPDLVYAERPADKERFRVVRRARRGGPVEVLVDLETSPLTNLDYFVPSPDGRYLAYGASSEGTEESILHVIDTRSKAIVLTPIDRTRDADVAWIGGDAPAILYARQPPRVGTAPLSEGMKKVHLRPLASSEPEPAVFGYEVDSSPFVEAAEVPRVGVSPSSPFAIGITDRGVADAMKLTVKLRADLSNGKKPWRVVVPAASGVIAWGLRGRDLFTIEYAGAPRHQLVRYTLNEDGSESRRSVILPEQKVVLRELKVAKDALYLTALDAGVSRLFAVSFEGGAAREISIPADASINAITADPTQPGCVVKVETWTTSPQWLACGTNGCADTGILPPSPVNFADVTIERTEAKSRDGTMVPMTILTPKSAKRDGKTPTMLYGYGSYGIPLAPNFQTVRRAWFDAGAIMAYAHVRGGGEFGRAWQEGGSKSNKEHSFEDFIACAETLVAKRVTDPEHLSAYGASAGGILVNSVVVRRPDLFRAVFVEVGDANMVRIDQYPDGPQSAEEFGSTKTLEGFRGLFAMDAYQHVAPHTPYPAMMSSTGIHDPRVPSWSPAKMLARVQAASSSGRPVLMRVDFDAGHGVGATRSQLVEMRADFYSFLLWQLGHPDFVAEPERTSVQR